jgi:hypothetical protein
MSDKRVTFPLLSYNTTLKCLGELGMKVTEADLKAPKSKTIRQIYMNLVDLLMGVNFEEPLQPQLTAQDVLEYPELHTNSIGEIMFVKSLYVRVHISRMSWCWCCCCVHLR